MPRPAPASKAGIRAGPACPWSCRSSWWRLRSPPCRCSPGGVRAAVWRRARGPLAGAALAACLAVLAALSGGSDGDGDDGVSPRPHLPRAGRRGRVREAGRLPAREPRPPPRDRGGLLRQTFDWRRIERAPGDDLSFYDGYVAALARRRLRCSRSSSTPRRFARARRRPGPRHLPAPAAGGHGRVRRRCSRAATGPAGASGASTRSCRGCRCGRGRSGTSRTCGCTGRAARTPPSTSRSSAPRASGIRGVDPGAEIVTAGLPDSTRGVPLRDYVARHVRGRRAGAFDVLNLFGRDAAWTIEGVRFVRRRGRERRQPGGVADGARWATGGPPSAFLVSEARPGRAARADRARPGRRREELRIEASSTSMARFPSLCGRSRLLRPPYRAAPERARQACIIGI